MRAWLPQRTPAIPLFLKNYRFIFFFSIQMSCFEFLELLTLWLVGCETYRIFQTYKPLLFSYAFFFSYAAYTEMQLFYDFSSALRGAL